MMEANENREKAKRRKIESSQAQTVTAFQLERQAEVSSSVCSRPARPSLPTILQQTLTSLS